MGTLQKFQGVKDYIAQKENIRLTVLYDLNYLFIKGGGNKQTTENRIRDLLTVVSNRFEDYFNLRFDKNPIFKYYELGAADVYARKDPNGTYYCKSLKENYEQTQDILYSTIENTLRTSNLLEMPDNNGGRPVVVLFTSCSNETIRGLANRDSVFLRLVSEYDNTLDAGRPIMIFSNSEISDYEEAYIMLHEFGHAFGSDHDPLPKRSTDFTYIMAPYMSSMSQPDVLPNVNLKNELFSFASIQNITRALHAYKQMKFHKYLQLITQQQQQRLQEQEKIISGLQARILQGQHGGPTFNRKTMTHFLKVQNLRTREVAFHNESVSLNVAQGIPTTSVDFIKSNPYKHASMLHTALFALLLQLFLAVAMLLRKKYQERL